MNRQECSTFGREDKYIKILVKIPGRMRTSGRLRCKWEHNIIMYHKETV
jgi:hypothetical protein